MEVKLKVSDFDSTMIELSSYDPNKNMLWAVFHIDCLEDAEVIDNLCDGETVMMDFSPARLYDPEDVQGMMIKKGHYE